MRKYVMYALKIGRLWTSNLASYIEKYAVRTKLILIHVNTNVTADITAKALAV